MTTVLIWALSSLRHRCAVVSKVNDTTPPNKSRVKCLARLRTGQWMRQCMKKLHYSDKRNKKVFAALGATRCRLPNHVSRATERSGSSTTFEILTQKPGRGPTRHTGAHVSHFHHKRVRPSWSGRMFFVTSSRSHLFYREKG